MVNPFEVQILKSSESSEQKPLDKIKLDNASQRKRKAFYSFKLIAEKIDFKKKTDIIQNGKDNIFIYEFSDDNNQNSVWIVWYYSSLKFIGEGNEKQIKINIGQNKAKITNMIPIDADGNFKSWIQDAPNGILTLNLTQNPRLIEMTQ